MVTKAYKGKFCGGGGTRTRCLRPFKMAQLYLLGSSIQKTLYGPDRSSATISIRFARAHQGCRFHAWRLWLRLKLISHDPLRDEPLEPPKVCIVNAKPFKFNDRLIQILRT